MLGQTFLGGWWGGWKTRHHLQVRLTGQFLLSNLCVYLRIVQTGIVLSVHNLTDRAVNCNNNSVFAWRTDPKRVSQIGKVTMLLKETSWR